MDNETDDTSLLSANITFRIKISNATVPHSRLESNNTPLVVSIVLALMCIFAFIANIFVIVTYFSSFSLRRLAFNIIILNLAIACLVECLCNMMLALYYITRNSWTLGSAMCYINTFFVQLTTLEFTFGITLMSVERWAAIWSPLAFKRLLTIPKQIVAMVILWLMGALVGLPFLMKLIEVRVFPARYACSMADNEWFQYGIALTVIGYCFPVLLSLLCVGYLGLRIFKERQEKRKKRQDLTYTELFFQETFLWGEWASTKIVALIILFYLLLEVPYIVVKQRGQLHQSYNNTKLPPQSINVTGLLEEQTSNLDTAFTWMRFIFPLAFPLIIFWQRKDFRQKFLSLFCCCKTISVNDLSPRQVDRKKRNSKKKSIAEAKKVKDKEVSFTTPVLYATSEGLHLRLYTDPARINRKKKRLMLDPSVVSNWTIEPQFISYFCDVQDDVIRDFWNDESLEDEIDTPTNFTPLTPEAASAVTSVEDPMYISEPENQRDEEKDNPQVTLPSRSPVNVSQNISTLTDNVESIFDIKNNPNLVLTQKKPKKSRRSVRFVDTITVFRPLTPNFRTFVKESQTSTFDKESPSAFVKTQQPPIPSKESKSPTSIEERRLCKNDKETRNHNFIKEPKLLNPIEISKTHSSKIPRWVRPKLPQNSVTKNQQRKQVRKKGPYFKTKTVPSKSKPTKFPNGTHKLARNVKVSPTCAAKRKKRNLRNPHFFWI